MIKALLIKRNENNDLNIQEITLKNKNNLERYYKLLNCDLIDIQERKINNVYYDFIFDDEYMLKENEKNNITASGLINNEIKELIRGNLIICGLAKNGLETTLKESDISSIKKSIIAIQNENTNEIIETIKYTF